MKFKVFDEGKIVECDIVCTFLDESNNINYIIYTDGTKNEDGTSKIYASRYVIEKGSIVLKAIERDCEWDLIDNMLKSKGEEVNEG